MRSLSLLPFGLLCAACSAMGGADFDAGDGDDDDDASDGDADADADTDTDADADADGGVDRGEDSEGTCLDGFDNDDDDLVDCSDTDCLSFGACCEDSSAAVLTDAFDGPLDLGLWKPFGDRSLQVADSTLYPNGDDRYETGVVSTEAHHLEGELELKATITVPDPCAGCTELVGVALTATDQYGASSTVDPIAGVVFDISTGNLLAVVQGVVEAQLAMPGAGSKAITIQILPDRRVAFFDADGLGLYTSAAPIDPGASDLFVALFGRGGLAAGIEDVVLSSRLCSVPSSGLRLSDPVVEGGAAAFAASAARSPSAAVVSDGRLEMLFTGVSPAGPSIGRAYSDDGGRTWTWEHAETTVLRETDLPVGWEDADDPALAILPGGTRLAAVSVAAAGDASVHAIATMTSDDGLRWDLQTPQPVAIPAFCRSARDPSLLVLDTGDLELYFACQAADGRSSIARMTSPDGVAWNADAAPVLEASGDAEADGIAAPSVVLDPDTLVRELWYEARDGFVRTIRHAISADGLEWIRWEGEVLGPGAPGSWDDLAVGDPSVTIMPDRTLKLFYTGHGETGQAIGLVDRRLPTL